MIVRSDSYFIKSDPLYQVQLEKGTQTTIEFDVALDISAEETLALVSEDANDKLSFTVLGITVLDKKVYAQIVVTNISIAASVVQIKLQSDFYTIATQNVFVNYLDPATFEVTLSENSSQLLI